MRILRQIFAVAMAAVVSGCAAEPKLALINDPAERLRANGFSIQPPRGSDWYRMTAPDQPADVLIFHKKSAGQQKTGHTFAAMARLIKINETPFESAGELETWLDRTFMGQSPELSPFCLLGIDPRSG